YKEAKKIESSGNETIVNTQEIKLYDINKIIDKYFKLYPNFISLDIEGYDFEVIKTLNFNKYKPEVICVETIEYTTNNSEGKRQEIIDFMNQKGYLTFADTYINTIFVYEKKWRNR
ncbi:FkbM family methyltransferase, partial [bacterium]|nr:FkbM family methyltransferase [bacterium]